MTQMVGYNSSYNDLQDIQTVCMTISGCAKAIKDCERLIKDHTGLRTGRRPNPHHATKWEMRQALNLPTNYPIDARYSGSVDSMGNVTVIDKLSNNKIAGQISCAELDDRQMDPKYNPQAGNQAYYVMSTNQNIPYKMPMSVNTPINIQNAAQAGKYAQASGNRILMGLTGILSGVTLIAGIVKVIGDIQEKGSATASVLSTVGSRLRGALLKLLKAKSDIDEEKNANPDLKAQIDQLTKNIQEYQKDVINLQKMVTSSNLSDYERLKRGLGIGERRLLKNKLALQESINKRRKIPWKK